LKTIDIFGLVPVRLINNSNNPPLSKNSTRWKSLPKTLFFLVVLFEYFGNISLWMASVALSLFLHQSFIILPIFEEC
jgi:hypothetical protein